MGVPMLGCIGWGFVILIGCWIVSAVGAAIDSLSRTEWIVLGGLLGLVVVGAVALFVAKARHDAARKIVAAREAEARAERALEERRQALEHRFGAEATKLILKHQVWIGATTDMVIEAIGQPSAIDEKVLKTKTKHVLKYVAAGSRRPALKITVEDGRVVGWEGEIEPAQLARLTAG